MLTEKTDLKTDAEINLQFGLKNAIQTISIGIEPKTGFQMFRRYLTLENNIVTKQDRIGYEEWLVAADGKIYEDFYFNLHYVVVDNLDTGHLSFTTWINQLAPALLPAINQTLGIIPIDANDNYVTS